ncbi:hypothetical protein MIS45_01670 [Wielerella bovis]|uniref:hypothetical protein n=1 Tax=Wielerella bovis TaxID=2917790 RepID=UPI002019324E|nr:hypothetical protein [Wielerella bovis]ULJ69600.1 hypothetical protein MIS45_01670 [Wielerella bovis]
MKLAPILCISLWLTACANPLPEKFTAQNLQLIVYQNQQGERILPTPRAAGEQRTAAWQKWLTTHRNQWDTSANQSVSGSTQWCAQWQENGTEQRICKRNGDTLVWFAYGVLRDKNSIHDADKIWIGSLKTTE